MMNFYDTQFVLLCCVGLLTAGSILSEMRITKLEKQNQELWYKLNSMEVLMAVAEEIRK